MRILIAANSVDHEVCAGLSLRKLIREFSIREINPILYSAHGAEHLKALQAATVPVLEDLQVTGVRPDLIHGHHAADTLIALLFFSDVPALFFYDHAKPGVYPPLNFPRIIRYLVPNSESADELRTTYGISTSRIQLFNGCSQRSGSEAMIGIYKDVTEQYRCLSKSPYKELELQITANYLRNFKIALKKCEEEIASLFDSLDETRLQLKKRYMM